MGDCITIPRLFEGAKEYKDDPNALEMAQATFNEEGLYRSIADFAALWCRRTRRPARVLDLCAATGLCTFKVSRLAPVMAATLVDTDWSALQCAVQRNAGFPTEVRLVDAATFNSGSRYDLVLANSGYHHIPDDRKIEFLKTARTHVEKDGAILVGEHFLPPYANNVEFKRSVEAFYGRLIGELERRGESPVAINVIRRSALYCWCGEYEYKVSYPVFLDHCRKAGLQVEHVYEVWRAAADFEDPVGSYAICLIPSK